MWHPSSTRIVKYTLLLRIQWKCLKKKHGEQVISWLITNSQKPCPEIRRCEHDMAHVSCETSFVPWTLGGLRVNKCLIMRLALSLCLSHILSPCWWVNNCKLGNVKQSNWRMKKRRKMGTRRKGCASICRKWELNYKQYSFLCHATNSHIKEKVNVHIEHLGINISGDIARGLMLVVKMMKARSK